MRTIHKFQVSSVAAFVEMPRGAKLLHVGLQNDEPMIWAEVDTDAPMASRAVIVIGTGHEIPPNANKYVGTFVLEPFVFHVYDCGEL